MVPKCFNGYYRRYLLSPNIMYEKASFPHLENSLLMKKFTLYNNSQKKLNRSLFGPFWSKFTTIIIILSKEKKTFSFWSIPKGTPPRLHPDYTKRNKHLKRLFWRPSPPLRSFFMKVDLWFARVNCLSYRRLGCTTHTRVCWTITHRTLQCGNMQTDFLLFLVCRKNTATNILTFIFFSLPHCQLSNRKSEESWP